MFAYQEREVLLGLKNLSAVSLLGSFTKLAAQKFEHEEGPYQLGNFRYQVHLTKKTEEDGRAEGAVFFTVENNLLDDDLLVLESLFDLIYGYEMATLPPKLIDALFLYPRTDLRLSTEDIIHIVKRAGGNKGEIATASGVDEETIDSWVAGTESITLRELSNLERAYPLLPWDLMVLLYQKDKI